MTAPVPTPPARRLPAPRGSAAGTLLTILLVAALLGLGAWLVLRKGPAPAPADPQAAGGSTAPVAPEGKAPAPIEPQGGPPVLAAPSPYVPKDGVVEVDLSEYAGYAGLVVANGGLAPDPDSIFARQHGFRVKLTVGEGETWSEVNAGRFAATATTADVLAVLGRRFEAVVPVQLGFSRGADVLVVDRGIASVNALAGKVIAASQFNESEFFVRYLAREANLPVRVLRDLDGKPGPGELGLVFYEDAFTACDAYAHELARAQPRLNGCSGWSPRTDEVIAGSNGRAKALVSNRNLLVVADVLAVNRGFAEANPRLVEGLVAGILEGNRRVREQPAAHLATIAKAFGWTEAEARDELSKVHLSNGPENRAFFEGTIDAAGSFGGIFQSAVLAYGDILKNPTDAARFLEPRPLAALDRAGAFAGQRIEIAPIRTGAPASLEGDPLLKRDIRFFFEPNSATLDAKAKENAEYLGKVREFLQVSPGSVVVLRGHVDDARVPEFRKQGGEELVRSMGMKALELSRQRALAVRSALLERYPNLAASRVETVGRGWEEPAGTDSNLNRRVEVQWFTLE
jgi:NitT/TauT family transport system substrate-binding protein